MRTVLDTNVLINGFKDEYSYEKRIIDAVIAGEIEAYANVSTLRENRLLVAEIISNPEYEAELAKFFSQLNHVAGGRRLRVVEDPEDDKILESAVAAKADYLISSDQALLKIKNYQGVKIVNPGEFWANYKDEGMDLWRQWTKFLSGDRNGHSQ